jgi:hypothetical protein
MPHQWPGSPAIRCIIEHRPIPAARTGVPPQALYLGFTSFHFDSDPLALRFPGALVLRRHDGRSALVTGIGGDRENAVKPVQPITL